MNAVARSFFPALVGAGIALTAAAALVVTWLPEASTTAPSEGRRRRRPRRAEDPVRPVRRLARACAGAPTYLTGGTSAAAVYAAADGSAAPALAWLTGAGVPRPACPRPRRPLTHPLVVWSGSVAAEDKTRLEAFATGGGVVVIDGVSAPAEELAGVSEPEPLTRDRLATLAAAASLPRRSASLSGATTGWHKDGGALARSPTAPRRSAVRRVSAPASRSCSRPAQRLITAPAAGSPVPRI